MITFNININLKYPEIEAMTQAIEDLRREVAEATDAQASAVVLIEGIRNQLDELAANATELGALKAEITALSADLSDSTDGLVDAITTPGGEEPTDPQDPNA